ncbi:hypothetical protein H8R18_06320 [Nanchangia anserum]|uniref:Uncharacterized protein n=1 Tax=Nanchangia anserum TaxID=2692125 RepID=A0A8I0G7A8_9ACTO|nr:hypothetical protein [Nanchangia anserum]MBD3689147.1 hypothetical protein [Nanchangia anserum]QOX81380.1 hypothetical protein H8R18_06320 [Nanchangia anserum]
MDTKTLARLLAVLSITLLGILALTTIPLLFDKNPNRMTTLNDAELLIALCGIGLIMATVSYTTLKQLPRYDPQDKPEGS